MSTLNSNKWDTTKELIRKCHLSTLQQELVDVEEWKNAFDALIDAINDERRNNSSFALEWCDLTAESGFEYAVEDILEEYFDELEEKEAWDVIISSCEQIIEEFIWQKVKPSQYFFREGNALQKAGRLEEAESFGKMWLEKYPDDYYAAASNVFLLVSLGKMKEAQELTEKCLDKSLVCDKATDTFFMAATRLYEITDNADAKQRIAKKIAEYEAMVSR